MPSLAARTTTTVFEALAVTGICFGLMIWQSIAAVFAGFPSSAFTDEGTLWLVFLELTFSAVALVFLRARGFAIATLYPSPTGWGILHGIGLYIAAWLLVLLVVAPFNHTSQPIDEMVSGASLSLSFVVALAVVNATFEEVFLLGFLVRGLRGFGLSVAIGASLLVRVLYHLYQGPLGALSVVAFGLALTLYFVASDRLWPPVFCHMLADIIPFL